MTIAVGIEAGDGSGVQLAWDSALVADDGSVSLVGNKGFAIHGVGYALAGTLNHALILKHHMNLQAPDGDVERWVVRKAIPRVRKIFEENHLTVDKEGQIHDFGLIIATRGVAFCIEDDWSVHRDSTGIVAIGTGSDAALARLVGQDGSDMDRATQALQAACVRNIYCRPPFHFQWVPADGT